MRSLRGQLDEAECCKSSQGHSSPHTVTASTFIENALQIEEQQYAPHYITLI